MLRHEVLRIADGRHAWLTTVPGFGLGLAADSTGVYVLDRHSIRLFPRRELLRRLAA